MSLYFSRYTSGLALLFLSCCSLHVSAKVIPKKKDQKNTITLHASQIYIPGTVQTMAPLNYGDQVQVPNQRGLSYERKVYKHLGVGLGFEAWGALRLIESAETPITYEHTLREKYRMIDLNISYIHKHFKHKISIGGGPSYLTGLNALERDFKLPLGLMGPYFVFPDYHRSHYFGLQTFIKYDYVFGRISAGAEIKYRQYAGIPYSQVNYGLHVGFNF